MKASYYLTFTVLLIIFSNVNSLLSQPAKQTTGVVQIKEFPMNQVKLLDGPFKEAMERDIAWLKTVNTDRVLVAFRTTAGIATNAKAYGGWESPKDDFNGIRGHFLGHYLSACSKAFAVTGDKDLKARIDYIVSELGKCQDKYGNGYIGAFPESMFDELNQGKKVRWVPWYTMHKVLAGLYDTYVYGSNIQVYQILMKLTDWTKKKTDGLTPEAMQEVLKTEQGGMTEVLADIYSVTQKTEHMALAQRFDHRLLLDNMSQQKDILTGLHANTQIPKMIGAAREYEVTSNATYRKAAEFFWDRVVNHYSAVTGGHSIDEMFKEPDNLTSYLNVNCTDETCNAYNMLKLTEHLFSWTGSTQYPDYYERTLINCILASQSPAKYESMPAGMMTYHQPIKSGLWKRMNDPENCFWCCTGTGSENHVQYGKFIYSYDKDGVYVNLFLASQLNYADKKMTIKQETAFPESSDIKLTFISTTTPTKWKVRIRVPSWVAGEVAVKINGRAFPVKATPGTYLVLDRFWTSKDIVEFSLPMALHKETIAGNNNIMAFMYGPVVLSGRLGNSGLNQSLLFAINGNQTFENLDITTVPIPKLKGITEDLNTWIKPVVGKPLQFQTVGKGDPSDITLIPYYKQFFERGAIYWEALP
jgi:Uncharacterized protein conserved in bacteria